MTRVFATGTSGELETAAVRTTPEGESRHWTGVCHPTTMNGSVDAVGLMVRAVTERRRSEQSTGHALERAAPISGDPDRLQQVVWNLLSNAIQFTPRNGRVQVRLERINSHVEIIVTDSGIWIAPDVLPPIFERFLQGERGGGKSSGLGLGLAIARNLVERHGGTIDATSPGLGEGSTLRVKLPLVAVQPARSAGDAHPTASAGVMSANLPRLPAIRVLVVEDDEDGRNIVSTILQSAGADVRAAESATVGFTIALDWRPHALGHRGIGLHQARRSGM